MLPVLTEGTRKRQRIVNPIEQNPDAVEQNPYVVEQNPYAVELNPDIDKPNLVDIGRLQCRRHPLEATKNFFAGVCTFGGLKRLIDHGYARTQPHRPGKEREKVAAGRGAFLWIGTESPGAVDSSVPAHESRDRFHPGADRSLPLSAQRMRPVRRGTSALGGTSNQEGIGSAGRGGGAVEARCGVHQSSE